MNHDRDPLDVEDDGPPSLWALVLIVASGALVLWLMAMAAVLIGGLL